jgi:transcription initiation factor IIE alpha subunit
MPQKPLYLSEGTHRATECPTCGAKLEEYSSVSDRIAAKPRPGHVTVCVACTSVLVYTKNMKLRDATAREIAVVMADPMVSAIIERLRKHHQANAGSLPTLDRVDIFKR